MAEQMAAMLEAETRGRESEAQARKAEEAAQAQDKEMVQVRKSVWRVLRMSAQRACLGLGGKFAPGRWFWLIQANNLPESALLW